VPSTDSTGKAAAESSGLPCVIDVPSAWMGVCSYGGGDDFPFRLEVSTYKAKKITGQVSWPTLKSAKTKMRGTIERNVVKFEEYEAISGADDVQIPSFYSGVLSNGAKTIKGKTVADGDAVGDGDEDDATFKLDLIEASDHSDDEKTPSLPAFKDGAKLSGTCSWEYPFALKVTKRTGDNLAGTIKWDFQDCETKFKGTVASDGTLKFEEYEMLPAGKNPVPIPMLYNGALSGTLGGLEGKCGPDLAHMNGAFKITLT